jgi:hypothetical protein
MYWKVTSVVARTNNAKTENINYLDFVFGVVGGGGFSPSPPFQKKNHLKIVQFLLFIWTRVYFLKKRKRVHATLMAQPHSI